ncbi:hypothetical protein NMG60_11027718 [Bertholletia excelsa]
MTERGILKGISMINRFKLPSHSWPCFPVQANSEHLLQLTLYPITLKFKEVVYKVRLEKKGFCYGATSGSGDKTILNGVTGMVCPGEILAMLGPSGSGKTTLLTALGGRLTGKLSGKITYNGQPFSGSIKRRTGFVAQYDVLYPHLTVNETLLFTALLRLPNSLSRHEKVQHVDRVIIELGLNRCRNSMIGGPLVRGISGGEKKRVSIGQEMLINPSLLLLDEPTSGLDSTTAQRIMTIIKGSLVESTIHMFDKVVLLSEGCPIYYGPASTALEYFSSIGFSTSITINPASLTRSCQCETPPKKLLQIQLTIHKQSLDIYGIQKLAGIAPDYGHTNEQVDITEQEKKSTRDTLISAYDKNISTRLEDEFCSLDLNNYSNTKDASTRNHAKSDQWCTNWWHQFKVLLLRGLRERHYDAFNRLRIFQVMSVLYWVDSCGGILQHPTLEIVLRCFSSSLCSGVSTLCIMPFSHFPKKELC